MVEFTMTIRLDGQVVAESVAAHDQLRPPPDWLEKPREWRDEDLDGWWEEAANVWLEGCWEEWPSPEPEQGTLL